METLLSLAGITGALCCVGMYAAVSFGKVSADRTFFYAVNGVGSVLILVGAAHSFDLGDLGTVGQECIWAFISLAGMMRVWARGAGQPWLASLQARWRSYYDNHLQIAPFASWC